MVYDLAKGKFPPDGILRHGDAIITNTIVTISNQTISVPYFHAPKVFVCPPATFLDKVTITTEIRPARKE